MKDTPAFNAVNEKEKLKGLQFKQLLAPGQIGKMELRNRMVMPPMNTNYADSDGFVNERIVQYYGERAEGGIGLVIVEAAAVSPGGKATSRQIGIWADKFIPGLRRLAGTVKQHGARIAIQLHHAGRQTTFRQTGSRPVAPSPLPCPVCREEPRALEPNEIRGLVDAFGHAARRAVEAGFEAVEIHGTHGYLINQFLSPYSNVRDDEYGGDREGRFRFALEVLGAVRQAVGESFPVIYRINASEYVDGGITPEEGRDFAACLDRSGVDALHVSVGVYGSPAPGIATMAAPPLPLVGYAAAIRKVVRVPVIAVGKIHDPEQGEEVIGAGSADFVSIGRGLIADSHFAEKISLGQVANIRKCIQCNQKCIDVLQSLDGPIGCIYNARAGRELEFPVKKAACSKKVVIVGAGPAGLEAARVATERGHRVLVMEQSTEPGGQALLAAATPHKDRFGEIMRYLLHRTAVLGVEIRCGVPASAGTVLAEKPDTVILATGAVPFIPDLPGIERAVTAWDVIRGNTAPGRRVVIIGGGLTGCETAEFLARKGHRVTVLEMMDEPARDQSISMRYELLDRLKLNPNVDLRTSAEVTEIGESLVKGRAGDADLVIEDVDTVVIATGVRHHNPLESLISEQIEEVYALGDCEHPRNAAAAINEAFRVAYHL